MRNTRVGVLLVGVAALILALIWSYNSALENIVNVSCSHGLVCPMYATIEAQRNVAYALTVSIAFAGVYLYFKGGDGVVEGGGASKVAAAKKRDLSKFNEEERAVVSLLQESGGSLYQSDVVKKTGFSKVRVTRMLDKLEHDGLVERKRRGMTNIVVLR